MTHARSYSLGLVAAMLVVAAWITWACYAPANDWRTFDALGVLISGLAFVGLVVTVSVQLAEIKNQEQSTRESLDVQRQVTQVLALSSTRDFAGRRIDHLKNMVEKGNTDLEGLSAEEAKQQIVELRKLILRVEQQLQRMVVNHFQD